MINSIDNTIYTKISDVFYEGIPDKSKTYLRKGTNNIYDTFKYGDIYIDNQGLKWHCTSKYYSNMGFLSNIYESSGTCYPCCYAKPKERSIIFNKCIHGDDYVINADEDIDIDPFILQYGRLILFRNKLSKLPPKLDAILNNNEAVLITHTNRISKANGYSVIIAHYPSIIIKTYQELYSYCETNKYIIFKDNKMLAHPNILKTNTSDIRVFLLIQDRVHEIRDIYKKSSTDSISISPIGEDKVKLLIKKFIPIDSLLSYKSSEFNNINNIRTKYFVRYNYITFKSNTVSLYIRKYFSNYFNKYVCTDDADLFEWIFITKIMKDLDEVDSIKTTEAGLIKKLKKMYPKIDYINSL